MAICRLWFAGSTALCADYAELIALATRRGDTDRHGHINTTAHCRLVDTVVNQWLIGRGVLDPAVGIGLVVESSCRYHAGMAFPNRGGPLGCALRVLAPRRRSGRSGCVAMTSRRRRPGRISPISMSIPPAAARRRCRPLGAAN